MSYVVNDRLLLKLERDTTLTDGMMQYDSPKFDYTYGFEYNFNKNFVLGFIMKGEITPLLNLHIKKMHHPLQMLIPNIKRLKDRIIHPLLII